VKKDSAVLFLKFAVSKGLIDKACAQAVHDEAANQNRDVGQLLIEKGLLSADAVAIIDSEVLKALGPQVVGGYEIQEKLGEGGMAVVYKATQSSLGRTAALKMMKAGAEQNKSLVDRFEREARAMASINHPNVVTCYDTGRDKGHLYIALEFVDGGDVEDLLKEHGGMLPEQRALEVVYDCLMGLSAIEAAGLVHRDIKPGNIFITQRGEAKLADLGLARRSDGDDRMTQTGSIIGTPAFMSPEQAQGEAEIDVRSDIYALGATLYAMLTGANPFKGKTPFAVVTPNLE